MKKIIPSVLTILCLSLCAFFMGCDPQPEKDQLILRIYNAEVAQAELLYLSKLDPSALTPEQLLEKTNRESDLTKLNTDMAQSGFLYGSIVEFTVRVPPPPTPCPLPFGCQGTDIAIRQFELGVHYVDIDSLGEDVARKSATEVPSVTIKVDSQHVFAVGKLKPQVDPIFKTARFTFAVVDGSLDGKDMVMTLTTTILKDGKQHAVEMNIPVPANTFSAD